MTEDEEMEGTRRQLLRLVGLMLALAGLAERAAARSAPGRRLVVWLLLRGEAVARDHVHAETGRVALRPFPTAPFRAGAGDALRLAARFRALAAILSAFADAADPADMSFGFFVGDAGLALSGALVDLAVPAPAVERLDSS